MAEFNRVEALQTEFTGERLVPGLVGDDLLNEHLSRYRFGRRFLPVGGTVLDAGCGTGYGSSEFADAGLVLAMDCSSDALRHAAGHFSRPNIRYVQGSCESLPFADGVFDLVAAFEVIEHLERWRDLLSEARRVLRVGGKLVVSTPNRAYYTESRGAAGANPFHVHEFEFGEFGDELRAVFPHVRIWTQNHTEAILFAPEASGTGGFAEAIGDSAPETANYFVGVCGAEPFAEREAYAWVPRTGNVLRERERHVRKLEGEVAKKEAWLREAVEDRRQLQVLHDQTLAELERQNGWASHLDAEMVRAQETIRGLQDEAAARLEWIGRLRAEIVGLGAEIQLRDEAVGQYREHVGILEGRVEEGAERVAALQSDVTLRTLWAQSLEGELTTRTRHVEALSEQIVEHQAHLATQAELLTERQAQIEWLGEQRRIAAASKWLRLGRKLGLGPNLSGGDVE